MFMTNSIFLQTHLPISGSYIPLLPTSLTLSLPSPENPVVRLIDFFGLVDVFRQLKLLLLSWFNSPPFPPVDVYYYYYLIYLLIYDYAIVLCLINLPFLVFGDPVEIGDPFGFSMVASLFAKLVVSVL